MKPGTLGVLVLYLQPILTIATHIAADGATPETNFSSIVETLSDYF
jgi:hypothetical protein